MCTMCSVWSWMVGVMYTLVHVHMYSTMNMIINLRYGSTQVWGRRMGLAGQDTCYLYKQFPSPRHRKVAEGAQSLVVAMI